MPTLAERSQIFAQEIQETLDRVLPGDRHIVSRQVEDGGDRYLVQPQDRQKIPIFVMGEHLADLLLSIYLAMDRTKQYLKAVRSDLKLYSTLDRNPPCAWNTAATCATIQSRTGNITLSGEHFRSCLPGLT